VRIAICTAILTTDVNQWPPLLERCWGSQLQTTARPEEVEGMSRLNTPDANLGVTGSLQWLYEHTTAPIIAFLHSDCEVLEQGWDERVLKEFEDERVGVVGFGGALQLGLDDIYRTPYKLQQLARVSYMSNQTDAEVHGERFTGSRDVATLDGFSLIVRRSLLDHWITTTEGWDEGGGLVCQSVQKGWPVARYPFHNYDNALCLQAAKQGYRVRVVGVSCTHHGGATATTPAYQEWSLNKLGKTDSEVHTESHRHLYEDGRGWLPLRARK